MRGKYNISFLAILIVSVFFVFGKDSNAATIGKKSVELLKAASRGKTSEVEKYIASGANINFQNKKGESLICVAKRKGDMRAVRILKSYGAAPIGCDFGSKKPASRKPSEYSNKKNHYKMTKKDKATKMSMSKLAVAGAAGAGLFMFMGSDDDDKNSSSDSSPIGGGGDDDIPTETVVLPDGPGYFIYDELNGIYTILNGYVKLVDYYYQGAETLDIMNTSAAYERGYTGYIINRDSETLEPNLNQPAVDNDGIPGPDRVKVGVVDAGFDVQYLVPGDYSDSNYYGHDDFEGQVTTLGKEGISLEINGTVIDSSDLVDNDETDMRLWEACNLTTGVCETISDPHDPDYIGWDVTAIDHGSHVAGIIGAKQDSFGMHGVAYNSLLIPVTVDVAATGATSASAGNAAAIKAGAQVVNNSWGWSLVGYDSSGDPYWNGYFEEGDVTADYLKDLIDSKGIDAARDHYDNLWDDDPSDPSATGYSMSHVFEDQELLFPEAKTVFVFSAGNDGLNKSQNAPFNVATVHADAAAPLLYDWLEGYFIAVMSVVPDASSYNGYRAAYYSNGCGIAKDWCLAAPGGEQYWDDINGNGMVDDGEIVNSDAVYSLDADGGYIPMQGTSMAAPQVSGAVALLLGAFPYLDPATVVDILFYTATDLGEVGVDEIYGHGLVNLDEATKPQGEVKIPLSGEILGKSVSVENTYMKLGGAFGKSVAKSLAGMKISALDMFGRAYNYSLDNMVQVENNNLNVESSYDKFGKFSKEKRVSVNENFNVSLEFDEDINLISGEEFTGNKEFKVKTAEMNLNVGKDSNLLAGFSGDVTASLDKAVSGLNLRGKTISNDSLINPYFNFADEGVFISSKTKTHGINLAVSSFYAKEIFGTDNGYLTDNIKTSENDLTDSEDSELGKVYGFNIMAGKEINKDLKVNFITGGIKESDTILGNSFEGAFNLGNVKTYYAGINGSYKLSDGLNLYSSYVIGQSDTGVINDSLISEITDIQSSFSVVGVNYNKLNNGRGELGLNVKRPVYITSGKMFLNIPVGRDENSVLLDKNEVDLTSSGNQVDIEGFYSLNLGKIGRLNFAALYEINSEYEEDIPNSTTVMFKYSLGM